MRTDDTDKQVPQTLPAVGFSRWEQLKQFIPISRESWRKLVKEGRAPQPTRLSQRCSMYANEQVHAWLKDPATYRAGAATQGGN